MDIIAVCNEIALGQITTLPLFPLLVLSLCEAFHTTGAVQKLMGERLCDYFQPFRTKEPYVTGNQTALVNWFIEPLLCSM